MATNTYVALAKTTGDGSTATITFSSIPSTYTDLVIVANVTNSNGSDSLSLRFNGDTGSNYSYTVLGNNGNTPESYRSSNNTYMQVGMELDTAPCPNIIHIMNYANTNTNKTVISRSGQGDTRTRANVGLWRSTSAITSITLRNPSGTGAYSTSSTFSLYGIAAATAPTAKATGGTITYDASGYIYHTFTSTGTFTPLSSLTADILVVAGGGGGGNGGDGGGGGGAGGLLGFTSQSLTATGYTCTVGGGGGNNANGGDSQFGALTLVKGGGGGANLANNARVGGSGGGANYNEGSGAAGTAGQGNSGGGYTGVYETGGGGGGAGAAGSANPNRNGGAGGAGLNTYSTLSLSTWAATTGTGSSGYYAGGGGGSGDTYNGYSNGAGGIGGGGSGSNGVSASGGGGGGVARSLTPGNGGGGVVIIRYLS